MRHPTTPGQFLLSRSKSPANITVDDIRVFDSQGEPLDGDVRGSYLERYIHAEIFRARPEVMAVIHSHSPSVVPFGVTGTALQPVYHMSAFLASGAPVFEIREQFGDDTDLLIKNNAMGQALAGKLGDSSVVLMRGHGNAVVGESLQLAVYRAVYTELNAQLQMQALVLGQGKVNYLSAGEVAAVGVTTPKVIGRTWDLWVSELGPISGVR
jgi:ribulose-5-phosphate 4-epimerase/fuculose-1-phosphate aldolase